jgi:hypothetical protein
MNVIAASIRSEAAQSLKWAQAHSGTNTSQYAGGLRTMFEAELSDLVGRLLTQIADESDARVEQLTAAYRTGLAQAQIALDEQSQRNGALAESLLQSQTEAKELRDRLQAAQDAANAARDERQSERTARDRAERESAAARAAQEQIASTYEARLDALCGEREVLRADLVTLNQRLTMEAAERGRLADALKTVQRACAIVDATPTLHPESHISANTDPPTAPTAAREPADSERQNQVLKLVASTRSAADEMPPKLREYLTALLDQVVTTYWVDQRVHMADEVVECLTANLQYAAEAFAQRARSEGLSGTMFFERALTAKLDEESQTSLGRHLAIAAYALIPAEEASLCAEAS